MGKGISGKQYVIIVISVLLMFLTAVIPPFPGLSQAGFQVLGILIAGLILWLFVGTGWPSFLVLMALMTVPGLGSKTVIQSSFGDDTAVFLMFCFMLAASLTKTGLARRISIWFITNKLSRRSPWWTMMMYFIAEFVLSLVLSSTSTFMIFLPIMTEILTELGYEKNKKVGVGAMMVLGTVIVGQIANSCTPISHAMSITGMTTYTSYTGGTIDFFTFCAVLTPLAIVCLVLWFIIAKYIWKPDISSFREINFDKLAASCGKMGKREKIAGVMYIIVLILWVVPGLARYVAPGWYDTLSLINQNYPPLVALFILNLVCIEGKPVLPFQEAFKSINWNTFVFIATIMCLGSCLSNADVGLRDWLAEVCTPIAASVSPTAFMIFILAFGILLTNFISNAVGLAIVFAIAMPLCTSVYAEEINPMAIAILMTAAVQYAWATPPGTPNAVVAADSGWIDTNTMFKWGMLVALIFAIAFIGLGIPLAEALCK